MTERSKSPCHSSDFSSSNREWKTLEQIALDYDPTIEQLRARLKALREIKKKRPLTAQEIVEQNSHTSQLTHLNQVRRKCIEYYKRGSENVQHRVQPKAKPPKHTAKNACPKDSIEEVDTYTEELLALLLC